MLFTSNTESKDGITSCLEASLAIIQEHASINDRLQDEKLPPMDFRVSADYGEVVLMNTNDSTSLDMDLCSGISGLDLWCGIFGLGSLIHDLWILIFVLGSSVWDLWFGICGF